MSEAGPPPPPPPPLVDLQPQDVFEWDDQAEEEELAISGQLLDDDGNGSSTETKGSAIQQQQQPPKKWKAGSQEGVLSRMVLNPHKAGLGKVDADKVNKIVYEASKNSPFYHHQQQLQKKLSVRIDAMLARHKKVSPLAPSADVIAKVDRLVAQIEKHRKIGRTIVHVDMDMFYAAVEMRDDPSLKSKPMAVGSIGMLTTANYIARQFGVRAAMPGYIGKRLCPALVIVPNNHLKYIQVSKTVRSVFEQYDPKFVYLSFFLNRRRVCRLIVK